MSYPYCERPHLVFAEDGVTPVALTNGKYSQYTGDPPLLVISRPHMTDIVLITGVKMGMQAGIANDDQSFTLLRPLRQ